MQWNSIEIYDKEVNELSKYTQETVSILKFTTVSLQSKKTPDLGPKVYY